MTHADTSLYLDPPDATASGPSLEDAAFHAATMLERLNAALDDVDVPHALLRDRMALRAAEVCAGFSGRRESAADLRDAVHLLRPGDQPGPGGEIFMNWRRAVERPVSVKALARALPGTPRERLAVWLDAGQGTPVACAAMVLEAVLEDDPRAETVALILADATLARGLGWRHAMPLLGLALKPRDLRKRDDELRLACYRAARVSARDCIRAAADLARRAERLRAVAPKLRTKTSDEAVALFLSRDAVAPGALSALMSDRSARRFCDRLVTLGVAHELTGRDTFRLFGL